jgi:integrase
MPTLTKRLIDATKPAERDLWLFDDKIVGLAVRVKPSGVKTFVLRYRARSGVARKLALGKHGEKTLKQARTAARQALADRDAGRDPAQEKRELRRAKTVAELAGFYLEEHAETKKKPRSVADDRRMLKAYVLPALGKLRVADVKRADVARLHHALRATPYQANRVRSLVSKLMNFAEARDLRPEHSNPVRHVTPYPERKRERFLGTAEIATLGDALTRLEAGVPKRDKQGRPKHGENGEPRLVRIAPNVANCVRLLLLTGARRGEVCGLRWGSVDFERRLLRLPDSKTGAKTIPLGAPAVALLASLPRGEAADLVFPSEKKTPLDLSRPWDAIRDEAKLPGVRIHDLRRTGGSLLAIGGESLLVIGRLLGHSNPSTTSIYARLSDDPLRAAAERLGSTVAAALSSQPPAVVVSIAGRSA